MHRPNRKVLMILTGLSFVLFSGGMALLHCGTAGEAGPGEASALPVIIAHQGSAARLDRPPVPFNHDRHTAALKEEKGDACAACHVLKETDMRLTDPEVKVFRFPKGVLDSTDKTAAMTAYHNQCVSCHRTRAAEGKKTGPDIGLCGKCHVRKPVAKAVTWAWQPVFNYLRHAKHAQAAEKFDPADKLNVVEKVTVVGETTGKKCETCHHTYDEAAKKVVYKKDTENSCRACHKTKDEKNARSMKQVSHAACLGCHLTLAEKVKKELVQQGRTELTDQDKKRFGPIECKGCHGEHKELTPEEIVKIPRLVRGQKDVMDLSLVATEGTAIQKAPAGSADPANLVRMKLVPFNHKSHEPRGQFCNSCHHYSIEKCANCHTAQGDAKKGGGITYERAFHQARAQQSCAGCHNTAKEAKNCAGCHQWMPTEVQKSSCSVCHKGSSGGKLAEIPLTPLFQDKEKVPEKLQIKGLEKEFKPAEMPHMKIVNKLVAISNESSLARTFHAVKDQALCSGCHHRSDLQQAAVKAPKCSTCHNRPFDPNALGKPGVLAAYHRQCIGCHQAMHQKPLALDCAKCHPQKDGVQMTGLVGSK
ncbi:MAG: cytochrome c3 family protein [Desulfomonile tiedjei]|nr:cytochrome c3 family protein [Desulfomonile tiedjei]